MVATVFPPTTPQLILIIVPPFFLVTATIVVYLRFWARTQKKQRFGIDDYLCATALVVTWLEYGVLVTATVIGGYGVDQMKIPFANIPIVFKVLLAFSESWAAGIALIQLSILALYLRIFKIITWFRYSCYVLIFLVFAWWASFFVTIITACIPLEKFWMPKKAGTCIDMNEFMKANLSSHIVLDFLIIFIVFPVIWNMKTSISNKVTISMALFLAVFSTACAITRFALVAHEWSHPNATGRRYMGSLFQVLENATGIICCSLPVMAFLVAKLGSSRFGSSFRRLLSYGSQSGISGGSGRGSGSNADLRGGSDNGSRPSQSSGNGSQHV